MTEPVENIEQTKSLLIVALVSTVSLSEAIATKVVNCLQKEQGDDILRKQYESIRKNGLSTIQKFILRAIELKWITQEESLPSAPLLHNPPGHTSAAYEHSQQAFQVGDTPSPDFWDKVRLFSSSCAMEVTSFSKVENNNKKERITFTVAKKLENKDGFDWKEAIYFATTPEEAISILLVLSSHRKKLTSLIDTNDGIFHKVKDVNKKMLLTTQENGNVFLELNLWSTDSEAKSGKKSYKLPINKAGQLSLSGFIVKKVSEMHPYYGMNYGDIIAMASHIVNKD